jgi:hypothetical protein
MKPLGNVVVKFWRIREPPYNVLVGILEHGGSLEWRGVFSEQAVLRVVKVSN